MIYAQCVLFCVVVNNTVYRLVPDSRIDILLNREGVRVILDCTQARRYSLARTCTWWWKNRRPIEDAPNVFISFNGIECIITSTISGPDGTDGAYTLGVCQGGGCYYIRNTVFVCGKNLF